MQFAAGAAHFAEKNQRNGHHATALERWTRNATATVRAFAKNTAQSDAMESRLLITCFRSSAA